MTSKELCKQLNSDLENGLNENQVKQHLEKYGQNKLRQKKEKNIFIKFLEQFKDVMIIILLIAAVISFVIAIVENEPNEFIEPALILLIVIINAIIGVFQENKAEKALKALQNMSAPHARVVRDGKEQIIQSSEIVVGDIIKLEAGDFVPADAMLIESYNLKSEESALTGESVPVEKDAKFETDENAPIAERVNMVFSGCSITYGRASAIVSHTGMDTEMGKIATLLEGEKQEKTPLQKKLASLGKILGLVALVCCVVIFIVGLLSGLEVIDVFMTAVSLAVSAIPEGLPAIVTIVLSIGVQRMVKKNAIIRHLPAVETLGSASIICSDKTGTLTQNKMTLVKTYTDEIKDFSPQNKDEKVEKLLNFASLCSDGEIVVEGNNIKQIGDPTETAIILGSYKLGYTKDRLEELYPRLEEIPFDSDRKLMSTINIIDGQKVVIVKGAFDVLAKRCKNIDYEKAGKANIEMSQDAIRVLAVGYKVIDQMPSELTSEKIENDLTFLGLIGMIDPPRPEAKEAVGICKQAGIKPIMITGDHVLTASAIAKQLGILNDSDRAITGAELDQMSDDELDKVVDQISVYARVSPENKIRIVKAWQKRGKVVAMTGDGVNDAPALKAADIGCAMGITGTDVAKNSADMTLTDDNFSSIVEAVKQGRGIYDNIKKVVGFLLGTNIGEIVLVFLVMLIWQQSPLLSMQLLWINLVTDSLPAIALGMEAVEKDVMTRKPKPKDEGLFSNGYGLRIALQGIMFGGLAIAGFVIGREITGSLDGGRTLAFFTLALSQILHAYNMRSEHSLFKIGIFTNKKLNLVTIISIFLIAFVMFVPGVNTAFGMIYIPYYGYLIGLALALIPLFVMEISKACGLIKHSHKYNK